MNDRDIKRMEEAGLYMLCVIVALSIVVGLAVAFTK
jgi:hypothetical protein